MSAYLWSLLALALGLAYLLGLLTTGLFGRREKEEEPCQRCGGFGFLVVDGEDPGNPTDWHREPCPACSGTGQRNHE